MCVYTVKVILFQRWGMNFVKVLTQVWGSSNIIWNTPVNLFHDSTQASRKSIVLQFLLTSITSCNNSVNKERSRRLWVLYHIHIQLQDRGSVIEICSQTLAHGVYTLDIHNIQLQIQIQFFCDKVVHCMQLQYGYVPKYTNKQNISQN